MIVTGEGALSILTLKPINTRLEAFGSALRILKSSRIQRHCVLDGVITTSGHGFNTSTWR